MDSVILVFMHFAAIMAIPRSAAGIVLAAGLAYGCGDWAFSARTPTQPTTSVTSVTQTPSPSTDGLRVWTISPNIGSTAGQTRVLIHGDGFEPGATVTLDDAATDVTVLNSTTIEATSPIHPTATVDVVVTNPGGRIGRMIKGYTYAVVVEGPRPSISGISPNTGTAAGTGEITITGLNFQPGAIVKINGAPLRTYPFGSSSTTLYAQVPAHEPGVVDVIVINPDGQSAKLTGGYRFATPGTLDFNGRWKGTADDFRDSHGGTEIRFTIENNRLVNVTCNSGVEVTTAISATITNDEFSFVNDDGLLVSGRFMSAQTALGSISFPPCGPSWGAEKQP